MSSWALRLSQFFLIGALMVSMGGHLAILQTFAWGNMLVDYSNETSLADAVEKTFDGDHPCHLCKLVEESKNEDDKKPVLKSQMKMEMAVPVPIKVPFPRSEELAFSVTSYFGADLKIGRAVPVPPPRLG
jgi:hypothetical protein